MFGIGTTELMVVLVVMLVLFGHRLPATMYSLGSGMKKFKEGLNAADDEPTAGKTT